MIALARDNIPGSWVVLADLVFAGCVLQPHLPLVMAIHHPMPDLFGELRLLSLVADWISVNAFGEKNVLHKMESMSLCHKSGIITFGVRRNYYK